MGLGLEARPPCGVFLLLALCAAGAPLTLTGGAVVCGEVAWREGWCCAVVVVSQNRALWPAPPPSVGPMSNIILHRGFEFSSPARFRRDAAGLLGR